MFVALGRFALDLAVQRPIDGLEVRRGGFQECPQLTQPCRVSLSLRKSSEPPCGKDLAKEWQVPMCRLELFFRRACGTPLECKPKIAMHAKRHGALRGSGHRFGSLGLLDGTNRMRSTHSQVAARIGKYRASHRSLRENDRRTIVPRYRRKCTLGFVETTIEGTYPGHVGSRQLCPMRQGTHVSIR